MDILLRKVVENMIKKILIIGSLVIALAGGSALGVLRMVTPLPLYGQSQSTQTENQPAAATNTTDIEIKDENLNNQTVDTDNIQDESLNGQDDSQEIKGVEADGEVEANEPANEQEQDENLPNGGHQDQDNENVDHQFEGVE